jgi:C-terminal processing protease CtpA/Prc
VRMGFGLISLLVVVAIIAMLWSKDAQTASKVNTDTRRELAPVTGRGPDDLPMDKSAEFAADKNGLAVTKVVPGGYFDQYFKLKQGDVIVEAGDSTFRGTDEASAVAQLFIMSQNKRDITVMRGGQKVVLKPVSP